jgi:transcriptional regulator with XRE-family HTH domain
MQTAFARRMGTTQSAIARLESGQGKGAPSPASLRNCARALGYRLKFRLADEPATARR